MRLPAYADCPDAVRFARHLPAPGTNHPAQRAATLAARLMATFRAWRLKRQTLNEIARLDNATLRDIGITRGQLHAHVEATRVFTLGGGR